MKEKREIIWKLLVERLVFPFYQFFHLFTYFNLRNYRKVNISTYFSLSQNNSLYSFLEN